MDELINAVINNNYQSIYQIIFCFGLSIGGHCDELINKSPTDSLKYFFEALRK